MLVVFELEKCLTSIEIYTKSVMSQERGVASHAYEVCSILFTRGSTGFRDV